MAEFIVFSTNGSITPEVFESIRRQLGIAGGVLDVAVSQVLLDRPRILPVVGQFVPGGMAKHMWVNLKRDASLAPSPIDDLAYRIDGERSLALADKHVGCLRIVPLQPAQGTQLGPTQGMNGRNAILGVTTPNVENRTLRISGLALRLSTFPKGPRRCENEDQEQPLVRDHPYDAAVNVDDPSVMNDIAQHEQHE